MKYTWSLVILTLAGLGLILVFVCFVFAGIAGAWHALWTLLVVAAAYGLGLVVLTLLTAGAIVSSRRLPWFAGILAACGAIAVGQWASNRIAEACRRREIQVALDAGLENDCQVVYAIYQNDPRLKQEHYIRLFPESDEFQSLPPSIRMFNPVYVTIEDQRFPGDRPPNLGLCKNGFGGFAFGVRVFMEDKNIPEPYWSKQISPTVYLWQEQT